MKNIESLVEEALDQINDITVDANQVRKILTTLAEKASQNGLRPLPENMPLAIWTLIGSEAIAIDVWKWIIGNFGTPPQEWWHGLEKGDKFVTYEGKTVIFTDHLLEYTDDSICYHRVCASSSSPYTEPTTLEHFMATLTPEQLELAKRLKIEEGEG